MNGTARGLKTGRGFSLIEVLVAIGISAVLASAVLVSVRQGIETSGRNKHRWQAFTVAQQQMEILQAAPKDAPSLVGDALIANGTPADATCSDVTSNLRHYCVNALGQRTLDLAPCTGKYELCWKVRFGAPEGVLRTVRVVVGYPTLEGREHVLLETVRF